MTSKLTANSIVFLLLTVFTVAVALIFRHPLLIYTAVFLVTTNVVLFVWAQASVRGLEVRRVLPRLAVAGIPAEVVIEMTNNGGQPRFGTLGYDLHGKVTPGRDYSPVAFLTAQPGTAVTSSYALTPLRSGVYSVGPLYLYGGDPFGFYKCWRKAAGESELTVLPSPVAFRLPRLRSASLLAQDELETVPVAGESTEFMGVREYRPGEPLKRLHWPTSARLGRLISRQFELNVSASVSVLLILSPGMRRGAFADNAREYALRMVAGLARGTISENYQFSYLAVDGKNFDALSGTGYNFYQTLAIHLARLGNGGQPDWEQVNRYCAHFLPQRSSLLVFIAELNDDARMWLRQFAMHFTSLTVICFNRQSFERAQRQDVPQGRVQAGEGYLVHEVGYKDELSRVLTQSLTRAGRGGLA
jgi:uncharacterized protein (DUF58 family)